MPNERTHVIRLNRVWELRRVRERPAGAAAVEEAMAQPAEGRIDLPWAESDDEAPAGQGGGGWLLLTRRFNRPSNLQPEQPVYLAIEPAPNESAADIYFNRRALELAAGQRTPDGALLHAVNHRMEDNNRVDIVADGAASPPTFRVRLLIQEGDAGG